ncbi:MAG TPA: hypothetical protein VFT45_28375 [Longimicrobium sp.]|nr:hypothetical protein [Longimicrobium sp.]
MLEELGLSPTGEVEEVPDSPVGCAALPTGWFLVFVNRGTLAFSDEPLPALSAGCKVVFCAVEEHVMSSLAACYVDGQVAWQVAHDSEKGTYHLDSRGDLPAEFDEIFHAAKHEQDLAGGEKADVDCIHDVPIDLAKAITGFRHDEKTPGLDAEPFKVLEHVSATASNRSSADPSRPSVRPWWRFW